MPIRLWHATADTDPFRAIKWQMHIIAEVGEGDDEAHDRPIAFVPRAEDAARIAQLFQGVPGSTDGKRTVVGIKALVINAIRDKGDTVEYDMLDPEPRGTISIEDQHVALLFNEDDVAAIAGIPKERLARFRAASRERDAQGAQWGGQEHDAYHSFRQWAALISHFNIKALNAREARNIPEWKRRLIQVIALSEAALAAYGDELPAAHKVEERPEEHDDEYTTFGCPRSGCSVGEFRRQLAYLDDEGNLCCPKCHAVVLSAEARAIGEERYGPRWWEMRTLVERAPDDHKAEE